MDIKAVKLLEDEGCQEAAEILKKFIDTKNILPSRINTLGKPFDNKFKHYERVHGSINRSMLFEYFRLLLDLLNDKSRCSSHVGTLIGLQNRIGLDIRFDIHMASRKKMLHTLYGRCFNPHHILAHRTAIYCMEYDQRGDYLITGSDDYTIKIWSLCTPSGEQQCNLKHTLRGHVAEIIETAISFDNHLLASVDSNSCLIIWCLRTGQPLVAVRGSRINSVLSGLSFVSTGMLQKRYSEIHANGTDDSNFNVSGIIVISSYGGYLHIIPYQHHVHLIHDNTLSDWTCCMVQLLPTIRFTTAPEGTPNVYWPSIACLDISPGGLLIAAGCSDQRIRLYSLSNPLKPEAAGVLAAHEESVNSVAFSHYGLKLATGSSNGGSCWLWKFQAGQWRSMALQFRKKLKCRPCHLVWSAQDRYLIASMKNGSVYVYFGESGQLATVIDGHEGAIHAISLSPFDEDILATAGVDGRFQLWNIAHHRRYHQTETDRPSHSLNSQSSKNPLILHYRFPPGELDPTIGLVWHFFEPGEDQPLWHGATNRRIQAENSHPNDNTRDSVSNNTIRNPTTQRPSLIRNGSSSKMQKITACKALPASNGIGFVVVTKSGLMSVFRPTESDSEFDPTLIDIHQSTHAQVDEQFLHWELDTAQWKEITIPDSNPVNRRIAEQVALVLGSPPASQSAAALPGGRSEVSNLNSQQNVPETDSSTSANQRSLNQSENFPSYQPPPSVLFEIIHVPSMVPFHRLPPGYLTNLRGIPYPPRRQTKVPGRENPSSPHDLIPSITVDEETGDDIVVDDIQFCPNPPSGYCPSPIQTPVRRIPGKNYMWCSNWLQMHSALIEPLDSDELALKIEERTKLFEDELRFFSAGGEPLVSFGDQYTTSKSSVPQTLVMQPSGNCFQTSLLLSRSDSDTGLTVPMLSGGFANLTHSDTNQIHHDLLETPTQGLSFLHSFLFKQRNMTTSSKPIPIDNTVVVTGAEDVCNTLNVSTSNNPTENANVAPPTIDDLEDVDDPDDASEESEWSETVDVEIGWWHRQRRRRTRRMHNTNDIPSAGEQVNVAHRSPGTTHDVDTMGDDLENQISPNGSGGTILTSVEVRGPSNSGRSAQRRSLQCRRSVRQQRRMVAKRRLLREMRVAELRAAKVEVEKRQASARRSERFRHRPSNEADLLDEDTTSRDTTILDPNECTKSELTSHDPSGVILIPDDISSRRERLKRRLIRSVDYALRTHSRLPLNRGPADGYQGPDCEGDVYTINRSLIPGFDIEPWTGPHFDWLSTLDPIPSPYIPQIGDSIVYLVHGHRDYVAKAWESGELPALELHGLKSDVEGVCSSEWKVSNQLPWISWADIPYCLCCQVVDINYHLVRIADTHAESSRSRSNRHKTEYSRKRSTRRTTSRVRQCTRSVHSKSVRLQSIENRATTDSNSHSSDAVRLGGDSFVRLVVLRLEIDDNQPYDSTPQPEPSSSHSLPDSSRKRPKFINVVYHDVDGILEFVILRHVFDAALSRKWQPGDGFICPVGEVWWRGRVLQDFTNNTVYKSSVAPPANSESQPSTSTTPMNLQSHTESSICDPWLSFLVRWLNPSEPMIDELTEHDRETILCALCSPGSLKRLPENVDRLSAWDMHPWFPEPSQGEVGFHGGIQDGFVHISPNQLRSVYGTSSNWTSLCASSSTEENPQLKDLERVIRCVKQIMDLPISEVFKHPVDLIAYPDYLFVNPYPVDLGFILNRLGSGYYRQKAAVRADFQQLLDNTIRYNRPDSSIVQNARIIYELSVISLETESDCNSILAHFEELKCDNTPTKSKSEYEPSGLVRSNSKSKIKIDSDTEHAESSHAEDTDVDMSAMSTRCRTPSSPIAKIPSNESEDANVTLPVLTISEHSRYSITSLMSECGHLGILSKESWIPCCRSLIKCLISNRRSYFFRQPIDLDEYPDYAEIIETPMDLHTILTRLDRSENIRSIGRTTRRGSAMTTNHYETVLDLLTDLNLIVSNSILYNTDPDTQVHSDTLWLVDWLRNVFCPSLKLLTESSPKPKLVSSKQPHRHRTLSSSTSYASRLSVKRSKLNARSRLRKMIHKNKTVTSKYSFVRLRTEPRSGSNSGSNLSSNKSNEIIRTSSGRIVKQRLQDHKETASSDSSCDHDYDEEIPTPSSKFEDRRISVKARRSQSSIAMIHRPPRLKKRRLHRQKHSKDPQNNVRRSTRIRKTTATLQSYYLSSDLEDDYDDV